MMVLGLLFILLFLLRFEVFWDMINWLWVYIHGDWFMNGYTLWWESIVTYNIYCVTHIISLVLFQHVNTFHWLKSLWFSRLLIVNEYYGIFYQEYTICNSIWIYGIFVGYVICVTVWSMCWGTLSAFFHGNS